MMLDSTSVKGRILDAAAQAFATHGVDQTSIDDIARDLGATKGKIYHHFGSKSELVCAIRKHSVQLTLERVRPQFDAPLSPPEKFHAMAKAHVIAMISELAYHRVVVEEMRGSKTGGATPAERALRLEIAALQSEYEGFFRSTLADRYRQRAISRPRHFDRGAELFDDAACADLLVPAARRRKYRHHCRTIGQYGLGRSGNATMT